jgi:hypothetical protein
VILLSGPVSAAGNESVGRETISALGDCWGKVFRILLTIDVVNVFSTFMGGVSAGCDTNCPTMNFEGESGKASAQPDAV